MSGLWRRKGRKRKENEGKDGGLCGMDPRV
jgi:hypothetical protein